MAMTVEQDILLTLASGVVVALLGCLLLVVRPRRAPQLFFGLFAACWGTQIILLNAAALSSRESVVWALGVLGFAFVVATWLFLARFIALAAGGRLNRPLTGVSVLLAVVAWGTLLVRTDWFVIEPVVGADYSYVIRGPAAFWFAIVPLLLVFDAALVMVYRQYRLASAGTNRHRFRSMLVALVVYLSYYTTSNLLYYASDAGKEQITTTNGAVLVTLYAVGQLILLAVFVHLAVRPPRPERRDWWLLVAMVVPTAAAVLEAAWGAWLFSGATLGAWRLLMVAWLVHALARYQLFDLDSKLQWTLRRGSLVTAVVGAFLVVDWAVRQVASPAAGAYAGITAAGGLLFAIGPVQRVAERLAGAALPGAGTPEYLAFRKLQVYRAGLEDILRDGPISDAQRRELNALRAKLGIRPSDAYALEADVVARLPATPPAQAPSGQPPASPAPGSAAAQGPAKSHVLPAIEAGATLGGRYRVERFLGQGAHGRAFVAFDQDRQEEVAVKAVGTTVYGGQAAAALLREARLIASIDHANVLRVREVLEGAHEAAIVMDYAAGGNLHQLLSRRGRLSIDEAADVLDQVLAGLGAAHAMGIVHRDIKPENLLLHQDGRVVVADFGVARDLRSDATGLDGGAVGTLLYMSPEQVRGGAVDARSDLYTAGVLFHQLLTGHFYLPLAGRDDFQVRQMILGAPPQLALTDRPAWAGPFLERALAKVPEDRYADTTAMRLALQQAMGWREPAPKGKEGTLDAGPTLAVGQAGQGRRPRLR